MFEDDEDFCPITCDNCEKQTLVPFRYIEDARVYDIHCLVCRETVTYDSGPVKQQLDEFVERKIRERDAANRDAAAPDEDDIDDDEEFE